MIWQKKCHFFLGTGHEPKIDVNFDFGVLILGVWILEFDFGGLDLGVLILDLAF